MEKIFFLLVGSSTEGAASSPGNYSGESDSRSCVPVAAAAPVISILIISLVCVSVFAVLIWKRGKAELLRKLKKQDHGVKKEVDHLKKLKDELKKQVDELKKVKNELKQNTDQLKDKLQLQEQKINEAAPGKLQELITGKEYILEAIWNLDETKKHYDKLLLHTDEILEALESR